VSQKYYTRSRLEDIKEDFSIYFKEWQKNRFSEKARQSEIRCRFSFLKYAEIRFKKKHSERRRKIYEHAQQKYDELFPPRDIFSMSHKA
jgi:hypothetical protein